MDVKSGGLSAGIGRSTLLKLIVPSSLTRTKKRRAKLLACESELLGGLIWGCGIGLGRLIVGAGTLSCVFGLDGRSIFIVV
ncbi:hypothetical protein S1OALGB6SA_1024 [Olavius algarvensis spirochete endosymbiont]|nr:hypothetical protein S1OALGB6SA_1024 [Olavius algarvensis spirochete endosymbiont]